MKPRTIATAAMVVLSAVFIMLAPGATPQISAQGTGEKGPIVEPTVKPKSFNGDLSDLAQESATSVSPHEIMKFGLSRRLPQPIEPNSALAPDPVVQSVQGSTAMPSPNVNFKGLGLNDNCGGTVVVHCGDGWPPDTNGDVGPNNYIETVNTSIGIYSKSGSRLFASTFNRFWSAVHSGTPCNGANSGDPVVVYDRMANRWLISDFAFTSSAGPFYECIAVSKSGDPVHGGWWFYAIQTGTSLFNDYPKFGVWPAAYYMTANLFDGISPAGARVWAFDRSKMINGQAIAPIHFDLSAASSYVGLLPGNLRGAAPPSGSPAYFAAIDSPSTNTIHVWKFHVDFATPANSWFGQSSINSNPVNIPVAAFTEPCDAAANQACIPEKGVASGSFVDSLGDRLMAQLQYRNIGGTESLWATHTVADSANVNTQTGVRWYQLDVTGGTIATTPVQQSTFKPNDGIFRWMPSLAVDLFGNMAVGYSASSTIIFPQIRYAGRLSSDPLGNLGQAEVTLIAGTGSQNVSNDRWGDYTAMTIDPTDDCTFWYTNEYYSATGFNWQTRIGSFRFPACAALGPKTFQENDPTVQYDGWVGVSDSNASGGSYRVSNVTNDKITFAFTGTSVKWVYVSGPDEGNAKVTIDGQNKGQVSLYNAVKQYNVTKLYGGLANASHTIVIQVLGNHAVGSTGNKVVVDAFIVGSTRTEDSNKAVRYNSWIGVSNVNTLGGAFRYSQTLGEVAKFASSGTAVTWVTIKGPGYGKAQVILDSVDKGTFDLYAPTAQYQAGIPFAGLSPGPHLIEIHVLHTKNSAATAYKVPIEGFYVTP